MNTYLALPLTSQIFVAVIAIVGTARITRFISEDTFPPMLWMRNLWVSRMPVGWNELPLCAYCVGIYASAFTLVTALLLNFNVIWVVGFTWLALAYLASILVAFDGGDR